MNYNNTLFIICIAFNSLLYPMQQAIIQQSPRMVTRHIGQQQSQRIQKRPIYSHAHIPALSAALPPQFFLAHGTALKESAVLPNIFHIPPTQAVGMARIAQLLFHQIREGSPVTQTANASMAAFYLSPDILGLLMGSLESGNIDNQSTYDSIVTEWQNKSIQNNKKNISQLKIKTAIDLIKNEYKRDKDGMNHLLLAFLYTRANPDNNHDMIDFLAGMNIYIPVFVPEKKSGKDFAAQQLTTQDYTAFMHKMPPYEPQQIDYAHENFTMMVSAIIQRKIASSLYCQQVIGDRYGFEGQKPKPDCMEASMRDLWGNILYDYEKQSFDISLLPSALQQDGYALQYFAQFPPHLINTRPAGQAFFDMVSNIPGILYAPRQNYEVDTTEDNFIKLFNHCFGTAAHNFDDLGNAFSDERRTITFTVKDVVVFAQGCDNDCRKITVTITDHSKKTEKELHIFLARGHAWIEVPERDKKINLLDGKLLSRDININPMIRSLFILDAPEADFLTTANSVVLYYALPIKNNADKVKVITTIFDNNPHNPEAVVYAYTLFKEIDENSQIQLVPSILNSELFQDKLDSDPEYSLKFNQFLAKNAPTIFKNLWYDNTIDNFYKRVNSEELKSIVRDNLWNNEATIAQPNARTLFVVLKGKLLGKDASFDQKFSKNLAITLKDQFYKTSFVLNSLEPDYFKILYTTNLKNDKNLKDQYFDSISFFLGSNAQYNTNYSLIIARLLECYKLLSHDDQINYGYVILERLPQIKILLHNDPSLYQQYEALAHEILRQNQPISHVNE